MHSLWLESMERRVMLAATDFPITVGGPGFDAGQHIAVDAGGNSIVTGLFSGTVDFKLGSGVVALTSNGSSDIYVAKYSPRGKLVWAKSFGSSVNDDLRDQVATDPRRAGDFVNGVGTAPRKAGEYVNGIALDPAGNVYLTGAFEETVDFDPGNGTKTIRSLGEYDIFVVKLDTDGSLVYADRMGGEFNDIGKDIAVDAAGGAYVTGYFTRVADFDPTSKVAGIAAAGRDDAFVLKLKPEGTLEWVGSMGGKAIDLPRRDSGNALALDQYGNVFVTGTFADRSDFNPSGGVTQLESAGETDAFVAYFSHRGKLVWVKQFGGKLYDGGLRVAADSDRNVYAISYFQDVVSLNSLGSNQTISATGKNPGDRPRFTDLLLTKFDLDGNLIFSRQLAGPGYEVAGGMVVKSDQLIVSGAFYSTMLIGGSKATFTSTPGAERFKDSNNNDRRDSYDVFAVNYTLDGAPINAVTFGSTSDDFGAGIAIDPRNEDVTQSGRFKGTVDFDPSPSRSLNVRSEGLEDIFLTKYDDDLNYIGRRGQAV